MKTIAIQIRADISDYYNVAQETPLGVYVTIPASTYSVFGRNEDNVNRRTEKICYENYQTKETTTH